MRESKKFKKIIYDPDALEAWVRDNYEDIYVYCYCNVRNREDAQDITQNVFLSFLSSLGRYVEYGKLKNYLFVIARNKIKDHWKKKSIEAAADDGAAYLLAGFGADPSKRKRYILFHCLLLQLHHLKCVV